MLVFFFFFFFFFFSTNSASVCFILCVSLGAYYFHPLSALVIIIFKIFNLCSRWFFLMIVVLINSLGLCFDFWRSLIEHAIWYLSSTLAFVWVFTQGFQLLLRFFSSSHLLDLEITHGHHMIGRDVHMVCYFNNFTWIIIIEELVEEIILSRPLTISDCMVLMWKMLTQYSSNSIVLTNNMK
jgi:hypothetical protein